MSEPPQKPQMRMKLAIETELMAEGLIDPDLYYRWLASELGLPYLDEIDPEEVVRLPSMDVLLHRDGPLRLLRAGGQVTAIVPEARQLDDYRIRLRDMPGLRGSLAVASPAAIRKKGCLGSRCCRSGEEGHLRA
jgi:hypothetical protein